MNGLNAAYLLWGLLASVVVVSASVYKLIQQLRKRWVEEADQLKAQKANTEAIQKLADKLDGYAQRTDAELNGHSNRIGRLEDLMIRRKDPT